MHRIDYGLPYERQYCACPAECVEVDTLFLGSGIGLAAAAYLSAISPELRTGIVIADAGPLDLLTHVSNTDVPRLPLLKEGAAHFGGKLSLWGVSTPRPPNSALVRYPYPMEDLERRFSCVEKELGVPEPIPYSARVLEREVRDRLQTQFTKYQVRNAPLAIDRYGRRWSSISCAPDLVADGVRLLPRFRCTDLSTDGGILRAVRGVWLVDGREYILRPSNVVVALGVEQSLPLIRKLCPTNLTVEAADHIRIDLHGCLPPGSFGAESSEDLGVAVLLLEGVGGCNVPFHLEVKVAPRRLWQRFVPSGDNLRGRDDGDAIYVQIQAIAAMHDRLPVRDLLNVGPETTIPPVMSARDAEFHGTLVALMSAVAKTLGIASPTFGFRPLLTNHHVYGAFRVGRGVSKEFLLQGTDNVYVLPPTSYVDVDDDANPTLKSLVLAQYAMESIAARKPAVLKL